MGHPPLNPFENDINKSSIPSLEPRIVHGNEHEHFVVVGVRLLQMILVHANLMVLTFKMAKFFVIESLALLSL